MPAIKPIFPQLNRGHPLTVGLRGCWMMNENAGRTVYDISGNNNTGTFDDTAYLSWGAGAYGASVYHTRYLAGSKYIAVPDSNSLDLGYEMTLIALVYFTAEVSDWLNIIQKDAATDAARPYDFYRDKFNKRLGLRVFNNLAASNNALAAINIGEWTHVAVTFKSGTTAKFYKNGMSAGTAGPWTLGAPMANTYPVYLSKLSNGCIAGAWIYDRVLTEQEIILHAYDPFAMARPGKRLWTPTPPPVSMPSKNNRWGFDTPKIISGTGTVPVSIGERAVVTITHTNKADFSMAEVPRFTVPAGVQVIPLADFSGDEFSVEVSNISYVGDIDYTWSRRGILQ